MVGERKPDWVYEMTDRRSLERVVRAAERDDIEIKTADSKRIVGCLPEEADHPFEAYNFDPNVYADEAGSIAHPAVSPALKISVVSVLHVMADVL